MTTKKYETVLIEKQDGITWLIMNRPDKRNAMSPQLHLDMDDALAELARELRERFTEGAPVGVAMVSTYRVMRWTCSAGGRHDGRWPG